MAPLAATCHHAPCACLPLRQPMGRSQIPIPTAKSRDAVLAATTKTFKDSQCMYKPSNNI